MMKRIWIAVVLMLLLSGCGVDTPGQTTAPTSGTTATTQATTEPSVQNEPGLYLPDSRIEQLTGGAVRVYGIADENVLDVAAVGDKLLVLSSCDTGMRATVLSGENCVITNQAMLMGCGGTEDGTLRVTSDRIAYYDSVSRSVVILNESLKETVRVLLPDQAIGSPVISGDLTTVFYCTSNSIHALDVATGISRMIRQHSCQWQTLKGSLFDDSILYCYLIDDSGEVSKMFLSAQTGQLLGQDSTLLSLHTFADSFFLIREEGYLPEYLFGNNQGEIRALHPEQTTLYGALPMNGMIGLQQTEQGTALVLYDLESGRKRAGVQLEGIHGVYDVTADSEGRYIWVSVFDMDAQQDMLYRWDFMQSVLEETEVFATQRYTREKPDAEGIGRCKEQAKLLGETYGVEILLGEDVIAPWDYSLTTEYRVEAMEYGLAQLEKALASYPEGFLSKMVEQTDSGVIRISLVRDISQGMKGLQYWIEGDAYIALAVDGGMEQDTYHEISHVMDNYIIANCYAYDDWEELNPKGAVYDYSYDFYQNRQDMAWLEGEERSFIDSYSMTYPKEDRARILEHAMMPDNGHLFESEYLQNKLLKICKGIRESFGYRRYEGTFLWEQYLETSIAYVKK